MVLWAVVVGEAEAELPWRFPRRAAKMNGFLLHRSQTERINPPFFFFLEVRWRAMRQEDIRGSMIFPFSSMYRCVRPALKLCTEINSSRPSLRTPTPYSSVSSFSPAFGGRGGYGGQPSLLTRVPVDYQRWRTHMARINPPPPPPFSLLSPVGSSHT